MFVHLFENTLIISNKLRVNYTIRFQEATYLNTKGLTVNKTNKNITLY